MAAPKQPKVGVGPSGMREVVVDMDSFKQGFFALDDTTQAPFGSLRIMKNSYVTNKGGLAPRPGITLVGTKNTSSHVTTGFFAYKKSFAEKEFLVKNYDTNMEAIDKDDISGGWFTVKKDFTTDQEFGYISSLVNTTNQDYLIGGNRYEPYFSWTGTKTKLNGALSGGETAITVDSTLTDEIFESQTATASSATTLTVGTLNADGSNLVNWGASQWIGFYVYITSGAKSGFISKITATTAQQITFDTLGSDPGLCTFEIKQLAFAVSGTLMVNGTSIAYTAIPKATTFTVTSANAASDRSVVTDYPIAYPSNPRGNRFANYLNRIVVAKVRSALARNSGGALSGFSSGGSAFVSKVNTPFDFSFAATRVAGEGDILSAPYGGGEFTDVQTQEDGFYMFKADYIEQVQYSQDANDLAVRTPLKSGIGSGGKTIKGSDDIYFVTKDNRFTSIGRVKTVDIRPETENLGLKVQDYMKNADFSTMGRGLERENKVYIPHKSSNTSAYNDSLLIYNKLSRFGSSDYRQNKGYFEGIWDLPIFAMAEMGSKYYFAESNGPDVYEMFTDNHADIVGTTRYPIIAEIATHFMNLTPSKSNLQALWGITCEGYIRAGTDVVFEMWKDFEATPFLSFTFSADSDTGLLDGDSSHVFLGARPLATDALAAEMSDVLDDGRRHFSFRVRFPYVYANYFSIGHRSDEADDDYEITRYGLLIREETAVKNIKIKSI